LKVHAASGLLPLPDFSGTAQTPGMPEGKATGKRVFRHNLKQLRHK